MAQGDRVAAVPESARVGLDAKVRCGCWEEGRTTPCPFPDLIELDAAEDELVLCLDWEGNQEKHESFERWRATCCAHEDMTYASVWVSNWYGVRLFQQTLRAIGNERFPTLLAELPNRNGGHTSPAAAILALAELDAFERTEDLPRNAVLLDAETGARIFEHIEAYDGIFARSGRGQLLTMGVDVDGFFVRDPEGERFRSRDFAQRPLGADAFELRDLATATIYIADYGVDIEESSGARHPSHLRVELRARSAADFLYMVRPLRKVFAAAVTTGNPVVWR